MNVPNVSTAMGSSEPIAAPRRAQCAGDALKASCAQLHETTSKRGSPGRPVSVEAGSCGGPLMVTFDAQLMVEG